MIFFDGPTSLELLQKYKCNCRGKKKGCNNNVACTCYAANKKCSQLRKCNANCLLKSTENTENEDIDNNDSF